MTFNPLFRTALLAGLIGTAGVAAAQEWDGAHHGFGGHGFGGSGGGAFGMLQGLSLTDAQKTQVHAAMRAGHEASASARTQMRAIEAQIKSKLAANGSVTMADVAPLLQQKEQLMAELDQQHMATMLQVRAVLTPEQISRAASMGTQMEALHAQERAVMPTDAQ